MDTRVNTAIVDIRIPQNPGHRCNYRPFIHICASMSWISRIDSGSGNYLKDRSGSGANSSGCAKLQLPVVSCSCNSTGHLSAGWHVKVQFAKKSALVWGISVRSYCGLAVHVTRKREENLELRAPWLQCLLVHTFFSAQKCVLMDCLNTEISI
jgi:hypothetical protein